MHVESVKVILDIMFDIESVERLDTCITKGYTFIKFNNGIVGEKMSMLQVRDLSHTFQEKELYHKSGFTLNPGEHMGLVGQNGVGKSTLMKMLTGELIPDAGEIDWLPKLSIGHIDQYAEVDGELTIDQYLHAAFQSLYEQEARMLSLFEESAMDGDEKKVRIACSIQDGLLQHGFYEIDTRINKIAFGLGIQAIGMERMMRTLSGGQRAKVILAKLLLQQHDVLLLDEPTNFLDKEHIEWLEELLCTFKGAFIVISHDKNFLNKVCNCMLEIEHGIFYKYHGNYDRYVKQKAEMGVAYEKSYKAQQKMIEKTEEFIRRNIAGVNTKMAQGRRTQLARLERLEPPTKKMPMQINFNFAGPAPVNILKVEKLEVGYGKPLLPPLSFLIKNGEKVVITGFNGIGKSTTLKTLLGIIPSLGGKFKFADDMKIGYFEQDMVWENPEMTPLQVIREAYPKYSDKDLQKLLAKCDIKQQIAKQSLAKLSGGEQGKVKLCKMIFNPYHILVLDEPTNHLDMDTKLALKKAIMQFEGTVIIVSHEKSFYEDFADSILNIQSLSRA